MNGSLNTIQLYGIQNESTYENTQAAAVWLRCGEEARNACGWLADEWMRRILKKRLGAPPDESCRPIMLFYQWENAKSRKPGMRVKYGAKGDVIYRLTFDAPRDGVVLCGRAEYESACRGEWYGAAEDIARFADSMARAGYTIEDVLDPDADAPELWALREALFESWEAFVLAFDEDAYAERAVVAFCWQLPWSAVRRVERYVTR